MDYGRNVIGQTGIPLQVSADGEPEWMPIGVTLDWNTVAAPGADVTIPNEGLIVRAGRKYLRYGQVVCRITALPVQTLTVTATGGTYTLSGNRLDTGAYVTTAPLAYNAGAPAIAAALQDPAAFGPTPVTVAGAGPYTITTPLALLTVGAAGLTGGGAAVALTTPVANAGYFGPFDPGAADGRQTLARGDCGILNTTVLQDGVLPGISFFATGHPGVLVGGRVWRQRLLATPGAASLVAGPAFPALEAALPRLSYAGAMGY